MTLSGADKCISSYKIFTSEIYFSDLRPCQFSDQIIRRQCEMFTCFLFRKYEGDHANYIKIVSCQATLDDSPIGLIPWPLRVIRGDMKSNAFCFASNF